MGMEKFLSGDEIIRKYPIVRLVIDNEKRAVPLMADMNKAVNKCIDKLMRLYREIKGIISEMSVDPEDEDAGIKTYVPRDIVLDLRKRIYYLPKTELRGLTKIVQMNQYSNRIRLDEYVDIMVYIVIIEELGHFFGESMDSVLDSYVESLEDINNYYGFDGEVDLNYKVITDEIIVGDARTFEEALDDTFYGAVGSARIWFKRAINERTALRDGLTQSLSTFNSRYSMHLATRTTYAFNLAMLNSLQRGGAEKYVYRAILDGKTSETCKNLNGKTFKVGEAVVGVNFPPMHPNCRSFVELD